MWTRRIGNSICKREQTNPSPPEHPYTNAKMQIGDIANRRLSMARQYRLEIEEIIQATEQAERFALEKKHGEYRIGLDQGGKPEQNSTLLRN